MQCHDYLFTSLLLPQVQDRKTIQIASTALTALARFLGQTFNKLNIEKGQGAEGNQPEELKAECPEFFLRGTWVAQWVERLTLDFGSGHDPRVIGSSPTLGSVLSMEPA